jgi:hypothetical protein
MAVPLQSLDKITESVVMVLVVAGLILWFIVPFLLTAILVQVISIKKILCKKEEPAQSASAPSEPSS